MLSRVGDARTGRIDLVLAGVLSFAAGAVNAVGFLIASAFSANMTGNVSGFAAEAAAGRLLMALSFGGLLIAFICGAAVAAMGIQYGERHNIRAVYAYAVLFEAALLLAAGAVLLLRGEPWQHEALIIVLCFVMGLQNAVTTLISHARVRTTHVSGMATDIGIELAALLGGSDARASVLPKLSLYTLTLACFALGGVVGAILHVVIGAWLFIVIGAGLIAFCLPSLCCSTYDARRKSADGSDRDG